MDIYTAGIAHIGFAHASIAFLGSAVASMLSGVSVARMATVATSAATANPLLWYVTRTAAVSAYITLTMTVILGLARALARTARVRSSRVLWLLDEAHPYLALLTTAFVALHLLSLVFDPLIPFTPLNLVLPIAEPYRPFAVDVGVLALYALAVVLLSSWLRRRITYARWRTLHYTSFVVFALVTLHGLLAGSDAGESWMRVVYLCGAGTVAGLALLRIIWPTAATSPAQGRGGSVALTPMPRRQPSGR